MEQLLIVDRPAEAHTGPAQRRAALLAAAERAAGAVPPAWPLDATVAVNPYLGQTGLDLATTAALLERVAGAPVTMPRDWYLARYQAGAFIDADLAAALDALPAAERPGDLDALKAAMREKTPAPRPLPIVAVLAADASGIDWPAIVAERFGAWAGSHFDRGQALWAPSADRGAYADWRAAATHDLTPEITGLQGFARRVADAPLDAADAIVAAAATLGLTADAAERYGHRLLMRWGGWSQVARWRRWQAELGGGHDDTIIDLLAIALIWEAALLDQYRDAIGDDWRAALAAYAAPVVPAARHCIDALLQEACERGAQRALAATLAGSGTPAPVATPALQAAFCIDVRSEVFRRALESLDGSIQTLGFAGFFGLGTAHRRFASDSIERRLPVLLNPGVSTRAGDATVAPADLAARYRARALRAWGRFKLAAVSSFAFVEASGPVYGLKLVRDALGLGHKAQGADPAPQLDPAIDLATRTAMAAGALRGMSLTAGFAPLVLLLGHGASTVNNPHASALHCGACGGYPGDVNARLLAGLLNDPAVRAGLAEAGIVIPADTLFVAGLHDTTTDDVTLFAGDTPSPAHAQALAKTQGWLAAAGALSRGERALRLPRATSAGTVARRSRDWAETRPEWALAGCQAFIAAPRHRTAGKPLAGRAFLHDYDWRADSGFGVLELILTAPVVVASWISLQYYGSTVSPETFGGGNKLLHNVVGGIGVVEGNGGLLRAGLPWQSVHDGAQLAHEPLRLAVCVEAPREAISDVLSRHPQVRALFDNHWLHLFAIDDAGGLAWRYAGDLAWAAAGDRTETPALAEPVA
jgi:uncharacterized protein YbcC (UPF0753/DUF2309 family)